MAMVQRAAICALLVLLLAAHSSAQNQYLQHNITSDDAAGGTSVPDRYVASYANDSACHQEYDELRTQYNSNDLGDDYPANMTFNTNNINIFEVVIYDPTDDQLATVEKLNCVTVTQDSWSMHAVSPGSEVPQSWGLDRTNQRGLPLDNWYDWGYDGSNSAAFIIDTGVNTAHPDWAPGQAIFGADCHTATCQTSSDPGDPEGHGTHVAGSVASPSYGVAKGVTIIAVRVLDASGSGSWAGVVSGIVWATNYATANPGRRYVINMSIGGGFSAAVNQAVDDASAAGIVVVVAAGNEGIDACGTSPAGAATAVTVGATSNTDDAAWWSNWGGCVNINAPGVDIESLNSDYNNGYSSILSGTSMASPHVAGAVAQILALHPLMTVDEAVIELVCDVTVGAIADPMFSVNALLYNSEFDFVNTSCPTLPPFQQPPFANCTGNIGWIGDGWCDPMNNNEDCDWDGGDCCESTCDPNAFWECGIEGYDCQDPDAPTYCPPNATVTGSSIPPYWANLAVSVGLDLNRVGFNTICELWMYMNTSTCIGWGEFDDHACHNGEEVCSGGDTYGTGISQVSHVAEMVDAGDDKHFLCPVCPPPPPDMVHKCDEGVLYEFDEGDTIPEYYEDPGMISELYPATWVACDCELHHLGHHLINESYWWTQATLTTPPLDPSMITYYDDAWGPAWYYGGTYTCVGMGVWNDMCPSMLFCGGGPVSLAPGPGKATVLTYGSAAEQLAGVVDALYNGGLHADCGYLFGP